MSAESTSKRVHIRIKGIVQGVGFRPFVYQNAHVHRLNGFVFNDSEGVVAEVEGCEENIEVFLELLQIDAPPLSRIDEIIVEDIPANGQSGFTIIESQNKSSAFTMLPPDVSLCESCKKEMQDPNNRRYNYPFINCTDCGPRYTIINTLPYDRKNTSMHTFTMCEACKKEYEDPANRRYHAEPISCPDCGPTLYLLDKEQNRLAQNEEALKLTCKMLKEGKVIALKGLGGFHIVCDAKNDDAVALLRERKRRKSKPLAVMFRDLDEIKEYTSISEQEETLITSKERPIVVVDKKEDSTLSRLVAPNIDRLGVFLPYTPLHELLLEQLSSPIVATSANLSDEPIIVDELQIFEKLGNVVDAVLSHNRAILNGCDDSVAQIAGGKTLFLRNSRGYAPKSLKTSHKTQKILALGANQKNVLALVNDGNIVLSPHIGDLNSLEAYEYFTRTLSTFERFYDFKPDVVVCDKHPEYLTSRFAKELQSKNTDLQIIEVQHHYAHALACMAEYELQEKVLAFCFDGTGYGDEEVNGEAREGALVQSTIWGGEVFIADGKGYERVHHLKPFRLLGSTKAVKEPKRVALSLLFESYSLDELLHLDSPTVKTFSSEEIKSLHVMWQKGLNSPLTSSLGRVFDAAASLAGVLQELDFEGQSGLMLEGLAKDVDITSRFTYNIDEKQIDIAPMVREMAQMQNSRELAGKLIATVANIVLDIAAMHPLLPVVLSGGVFQNRILVDLLSSELQRKGRRFYIQKDTPVNDASIALGQAYYAIHNQGNK